MSEQGITPEPSPPAGAVTGGAITTPPAGPKPSATDSVPDDWGRKALIAGAVGIGLVLLSAILPGGKAAAFRGWLVGVNYVLGIAVGSLVLLLLHHTVGGGWGFCLRRPMEAATRTLPVVMALFLPLWIDLLVPWAINDPHAETREEQHRYHPALYEWSDPAEVAHDEHLQHKAPYLNVPFAIVRWVIYFAVWIGLSQLLCGWSKKQDETRDPALTSKGEALGPPGMVLYGLTVTFFSIDFVMSLEPHWFSTIYGGMFGVGQVLTALTFTTFIGLALADRPPLDEAVAGQNRRDLGSLILAFVMVWAYLSISQFLLIWSGNLPEETPWYLVRLDHGWSIAALALVLFHFFLPFFLLLSVDVKKDRKMLMRVALLVLVMRVVDLTWLIVPAFMHERHLEHQAEGQALYDILASAAAVVGVGGVWLAAYLRELRRMPLLPLYNPETEGAVHGHAAH